jgi:hypothetical protein
MYRLTEFEKFVLKSALKSWQAREDAQGAAAGSAHLEAAVFLNLLLRFVDDKGEVR